jgi:excisionase family DNA binding protein
LTPSPIERSSRVRLLTVKETAALFGISPGLVYALCSRKRLRHERHGLGRGKIKIPEDAIEEYRRSVTVPADTPTAVRVPVKLKHLSI